ncbi:MAG: DUF4912 domain-containing protein [Helicobacteraceae bacterium]|jgi:hypothetical protein|nr:DUF4912 domain-containing protein [Helicobacteraceae bacterium]
MSEHDNPLTKLDPSAVSSGGEKTTVVSEAVSNDIALSDRYYENRLVLLPVNAGTQHFYWEIGDETLERKIATREKDARLVIRLYYLTGDRAQEVESVYSHAPTGNYYAYHTPNATPMEARMFVSDESGEREIAISNRISTPSSGMHSSPWEIWMTKNGERQKLESRPSELESQGAIANLSSLDIVVREERLKARIGDMANMPSSNLSSESGASWQISGANKER